LSYFFIAYSIISCGATLLQPDRLPRAFLTNSQIPKTTTTLGDTTQALANTARASWNRSYTKKAITMRGLIATAALLAGVQAAIDPIVIKV